MAEEIDDGDFYRENFSADSDWEVFNAQLGELLQKWEVANTDWGRVFEKDELFSCKWQIESESLDLLKQKITVDYYVAQVKLAESTVETVVAPQQPAPFHKDLLSLTNNFGPPVGHKRTYNSNAAELHTLARIFGLRRFIVMHPIDMQTQYFTKIAEFNFFLSSAAVIAAEVNCAVPIFVQIYDPKWNFFLGVGYAPTLRTNFDLIALEQSPSECRHLSGLLTIFKEKLPASYTQPVVISVRNTYSLDLVRIRIPMHVPFANGASTEDIAISGDVLKLAITHFNALPHGYFPDACSELYAIYTWPEITENIVMDSAYRTDFVPSKAPIGNLHLTVQATSYLSSCLRDYEKLAEATQTLESYVGKNFSGIMNAAETQNPLDQLTQSKLTPLPAARSLPNLAAVAKRLPGPMNKQELNQMLAYLFPEMHPESALFPYVKSSFKQKFDPLRIKTAVPDSLVCRLGCLLANINAHFGGQSGLAQLWAAFTREVRFLWDNSLTVPGISMGYPDIRTCLLHQKLQMLNVCIERSIHRQQTQCKTQMMSNLSSVDDGDDSNEDDEFYECDDLPEINADAAKIQINEALKPEGREKRFGEERLLDEPTEYIYIPILQEPVPKTEDQLLDDAEIMIKLGPGSGLTTQMMCSSLLSDMSAFKAANPKAQMVDFIRWYSPKDWEESTDDAGKVSYKMSARMLAPGNTWQQVWQQAPTLPAARQKRLFDDTNEALKVLKFLETRNLAEIYALTILPTLHAAVLKLVDIFANAHVEDIFTAQIETLLAELCRISRDTNNCEPPHVFALLAQLETLETQFYQYKCFENIAAGTPLPELKRHFNEILCNNGSCTLTNKKESQAEGGGTGSGVSGLLINMLSSSFKNDMQDKLISKDYILRANGDPNESNAEHGKYLGPQFLRAIVSGEKLRLCGAYTDSTTFI